MGNVSVSPELMRLMLGLSFLRLGSHSNSHRAIKNEVQIQKETQSNITMSLTELLQQTSVKVLPSKTPVIEVDASMTSLQAARILCDQQILGAPVRDGNDYAGFF